MTAAVFELQNEQRAAVKSESGGEARTGKRCAASNGAHLLLPRDALDRALEDLAALDLPLEADEQGRLEGQLPRPVLQGGRRTACVRPALALPRVQLLPRVPPPPNPAILRIEATSRCWTRRARG